MYNLVDKLCFVFSRFVDILSSSLDKDNFHNLYGIYPQGYPVNTCKSIA